MAFSFLCDRINYGSEPASGGPSLEELAREAARLDAAMGEEAAANLAAYRKDIERFQALDDCPISQIAFRCFKAHDQSFTTSRPPFIQLYPAALPLQNRAICVRDDCSLFQLRKKLEMEHKEQGFRKGGVGFPKTNLPRRIVKFPNIKTLDRVEISDKELLSKGIFRSAALGAEDSDPKISVPDFVLYPKIPIDYLESFKKFIDLLDPNDPNYASYRSFYENEVAEDFSNDLDSKNARTAAYLEIINKITSSTLLNREIIDVAIELTLAAISHNIFDQICSNQAEKNDLGKMLHDLISALKKLKSSEGLQMFDDFFSCCKLTAEIYCVVMGKINKFQNTSSTLQPKNDHAQEADYMLSLLKTNQPVIIPQRPSLGFAQNPSTLPQSTSHSITHSSGSTQSPPSLVFTIGQLIELSKQARRPVPSPNENRPQNTQKTNSLSPTTKPPEPVESSNSIIRPRVIRP
jgi:hypothetical protein